MVCILGVLLIRLGRCRLCKSCKCSFKILFLPCCASMYVSQFQISTVLPWAIVLKSAYNVYIFCSLIYSSFKNSLMKILMMSYYGNSCNSFVTWDCITLKCCAFYDLQYVDI